MGILKTLCLSLSLVGLAPQARADESLLRQVSECVGRFSAQMEHLWLVQDGAPDVIERQRAHLIDILETLTTTENATRVLAGRIDAKVAHASLLSRATFSGDSRISAWAAARAEDNIRLCGDIVLMPAEPTRTSALSVLNGPETMNRHAVQIRQ